MHTKKKQIKGVLNFDKQLKIKRKNPYKRDTKKKSQYCCEVFLLEVLRNLKKKTKEYLKTIFFRQKSK